MLKRERERERERDVERKQEQLTACGLPVRQPQDEELHEGRLQQQLLVLGAEGGEPGDALRPLADHVHGPRQQVIELPYVICVLLLRQTGHRLLVLDRRSGKGFVILNN
ncbi:hypothetical protein ANANG_G00220720 [Anguilla anguilla]|uniref:Uncharacterized protein n=1 Tax=Anguilla anguilla TaxID=7936 RepID=A0A9D3LZS7_ANGAN|nr:hypothetical protein ANANG_G00220720 [Anguilla anguilla]